MKKINESINQKAGGFLSCVPSQTPSFPPSAFDCFLSINPVAKGRPRFNKNGFAYTPEKTRQAEDEMMWALKNEAIKQGWKMSLKPLSITVIFHLAKPKSSKNKYPIVRPDIDNYLKLVFDSANGVLWKDDSQIIYLHSSKVYSTEKRGITIQVRAVEE